MMKKEQEKTLTLHGTTDSCAELMATALVIGKRYDKLLLRLGNKDGCYHCQQSTMLDDKSMDKLATFLRRAAQAARVRRREWERQMRKTSR